MSRTYNNNGDYTSSWLPLAGDFTLFANVTNPVTLTYGDFHYSVKGNEVTVWGT